jgi:predicted nucleotidyltransferase
LNDHDVRYVVIGGVAAIVHGVPRTTFDVDLLIEASEENATSLLAALEDAGLATAALTSVADVLSHEITVFRDRVRVDVQTRTPGLDFADAWSRRVTREVAGVVYHLVCRDDLIASKTAAGRDRDLEDVRILTNQ